MCLWLKHHMPLPNEKVKTRLCNWLSDNNLPRLMRTRTVNCTFLFTLTPTTTAAALNNNEDTPPPPPPDTVNHVV